MFFLVLGILIAVFAYWVWDINRVSVFYEISKEDWTGSVQCRSRIHSWSAEWKKNSDQHYLRVRLLFISISVPLKKSLSGKSGTVSGKVGFFFHQFQSFIDHLDSVTGLLKKMQDIFHIDHWEIEGQTSLWDPVQTGKLFVILKMLENSRLMPASMHIRPLFYPARSFIQCRGIGHFTLFHLFRLAWRERSVWIPWISKNNKQGGNNGH
jgi:hypothetical protein